MKIRINITKAARKRIGLRIINFIRENTLAGIDADGDAFEPYSDKPFAMPAGAATNRVFMTLGKTGEISWFTTKKGAKWIVIKGGYVVYKAAKRPADGGRVNLTDTGGMLRALKMKLKGDLIVILFSNPDAATKAYWQLFGRTVRDFLGFTDAQARELQNDLGDAEIEIEQI